MAERDTVIYDGSCGFCVWSVSHARAFGNGRLATFIPYQLLDFVDAPAGVSESLCRNGLVFIDAEGTVTNGADAVNSFLKRTPLAWLIRNLESMPLLLCLERAIYRSIARNRAVISRLLGTSKYSLLD